MSEKLNIKSHNSKVIAALEAENAQLKQLLIEAILLPNTMIADGASEFITDAELAEIYKHKPQIENQVEKIVNDAVQKANLDVTAKLKHELAMVDEALARRPALDKYSSRYEKICAACAAAGKYER